MLGEGHEAEGITVGNDDRAVMPFWPAFIYVPFVATLSYSRAQYRIPLQRS